jgi:aladin
LDVSEYELPNGQMVGGAVHDMVWDQNSQRLVISFRDNPEFLAVFRTNTRSILEIEPLGLIHGLPGEKPLLMDFHDSFKKGSLLTICWSSGFLSHIPFQYSVLPAVTRHPGASSVMTSTPRSLTSFCRSPGLMSSPPSSPVASPIPNHRSLMTHNYTSFMSDDLTINFASASSPHHHHHLLSSDSVMSPRKPVLFSTMTSATAAAGRQRDSE